MARDIKLPQLGQTMEEGTVVSVLIKEGDEIRKGDVIFEIETDKATLEMESPAEGYVKKILVEQGQTIPVNTALVIVGDKDEQVPQSFIDALSEGGSDAASQETAPPAVEEPTEKIKTDTSSDTAAIEPSSMVSV